MVTIFQNEKQNRKIKKTPLTPARQTLGNEAPCKFSKFVLSLFGWFFLLWFFWLFLSLCFFNNSTFEYTFWKQAASAVSLAAAMVLGYWGMQRLLIKKQTLKKLMKHRFILVLSVGMALIFVCQMIYVGLTTTSIGWDVGTLVRYAKAPDMGTTANYFKQYPNNLFLLLFDRFWVLVFHFFKLPGVWAGLNVINVIAIDIAIVLTVLIARRLFGRKGAYISWFFCIAAVAFFPYLIVPYSDTMAMPFGIAVFYCYLRACEGKNKTRVFFSLLMGFCACVGTLIKPTVVIPLIAVILIHFFYHLKNKKLLFKSALPFLLACAVFVISNASYQAFAAAHYPKNEDMSTPMTHFAMMGLHENKLPNGFSIYGGYYNPDVQSTATQPTKEAKVAHNLNVIQNRIKKMGVFGYLEYLNSKARWITSEGNFFWGGEGNFANFDYMTDSFVKELINSGSNIFGMYLKEDGKTQPGDAFDIYFYFSQAVWIILMFFLILPLFLKDKGFGNKNVMILRCSIFGLMLFLLLFEGRSRYLIYQLPYFILLASYGASNLLKQIQK